MSGFADIGGSRVSETGRQLSYGNRALAHPALSASHHDFVLDPGHAVYSLFLPGSWVITASFVSAGAAKALAAIFADII
jgi:hypothetical protein